MDWSTHICDIDTEPLHRYHKGGYHPVHLGDCLINGRYKVLHELGWGGYSTVWAARDTRNQTYVAVKIAVSEPNHQNRETTVLRTIGATHSDQPGYQYLMTMQDSFQIIGPNGTYACLVLELLGPSVADLFDAHSCIERLPGTLAKTIAKQALLGLCFLHEQKIAHADLHTRNLAFAIPPVQALREEDFLQKLGQPETGIVQKKDGQPLGPGVPRYLVKPTSYPIDVKSSFRSIKIVDFGQSFLSDECPGALNTPLPVRAPEIIFRDKVDYRVDLWSMGCLLIVGQPLFDSFMTTPAILVRQMLETVDDGLPNRWNREWHAMKGTLSDNSSNCSLQDWLEEMYFDGERREDMSQEDIVQVGVLIGSMLRMEPSVRASAKAVVQVAWFQRE
ncbi:kinase-like protein [Plenodomus tracheiphilus IPT5]|uniref:non-specific serine/threonine protein kinase n=1 Tax=Plenodomus tracheiphilus IPT5 TaxID=1408161 RepID=A0A6A7APN4_9PLEO|nr:kinase-like protein [Plenodomus tracheiphilus IPT5]